MKLYTYTELKDLIHRRLQTRRPLILDPPDFKHSAVLMPILLEDNCFKFILTKRADTLKHHRGEISFPGGQREKDDKNLLETALRETEEEIGVKKSQIEVLGRLDDLLTITRYIISPFVGIIHDQVECMSNDAEVAELLHVPLEFFLSSDKFKEKSWFRNGTNYPLYYYYWGDYEIWGATGYIINQFIEIVFGFQPSKINFKRNDPNLIEQFLR
ncbi:MAG: NUDIX hydrolase [Candidatus Helarchaeota archaeon]